MCAAVALDEHIVRASSEDSELEPVQLLPAPQRVWDLPGACATLLCCVMLGECLTPHSESCYILTTSSDWATQHDDAHIISDEITEDPFCGLWSMTADSRCDLPSPGAAREKTLWSDPEGAIAPPQPHLAPTLSLGHTPNPTLTGGRKYWRRVRKRTRRL